MSALDVSLLGPEAGPDCVSQQTQTPTPPVTAPPLSSAVVSSSYGGISEEPSSMRSSAHALEERAPWTGGSEDSVAQRRRTPDMSGADSSMQRQRALLPRVPAPDLTDDTFHSMVLALLFALVNATILGLALVPGWESAHATEYECSVVASDACEYERGLALGHRNVPLAASWVGGEPGEFGPQGREHSDYLTASKECCQDCQRHGSCTVATFVEHNVTDPTPNCFLYAASGTDKVALEGAWLCSLLTDDDSAISAATRGPLERKLHTLLGASAVLARFGWLIYTSLLGKLLQCIGYGGAGLVDSMFAPRKAAIAARAAAEATAHEQTAVVPAAAGWEAVGAPAMRPGEDEALFRLRPSTWTEAREALGLSERQAMWSCGSKLLLWHWSQPLAFLAVFGTFYCSLPGDGYPSQRYLGTIVAFREASYLVSTLLAVWINPAYLLLELNNVLKPTEEVAEGHCCCPWWRRLDGNTFKLWGLYLLSPHHFVAFCLFRGCKGRWGSDSGIALLVFIGTFVMNAIGDVFSPAALYLLLQQPSPPAALAIGYWLTTTGMVSYFGGLLAMLLSWTCKMRNCVSRCCSSFGIMLLFCYFFAMGLGLIVVAPLQLSGAMHGLAQPCHSKLCILLSFTWGASWGA